MSLYVGCGTQTGEIVEKTVGLIHVCDIVIGRIVPYSVRAGTPAAKMPQGPVPVREERAARLRAASATRLDRWLASLVGTTQRLLVEREDGRGHGESFAPIRIDGGGEPGGIVTVKTSGVADGMLESVQALAKKRGDAGSYCRGRREYMRVGKKGG